jgi:peptidoglycan/LPS O-acetylase OafA/YrhL
MGVYRFILAALVVLFHFGGLDWIVGRIAVFAFYCISGFLIFQVLDRVYLGEPRGVWRFLCNRFVRLFPLYVAYTLMTLAMLRWLGPTAMLDPDGRPILPGIDRGTGELLRQALTFDPHLSLEASMPVLEFIPTLIPQGWSIGVEITFYLIAPLVVLTTRHRTWRLVPWVAAGLVAFLWGVRTAGLDLERFQVLVYKNAVASAVVFFAGGAFYYARRRWGQPASFWAVALVILAWIAVVTVPALELGERGVRSASMFAEYLWVTVLLVGLVTLTQVRRLRALDVSAGNLCYGVYLNHFLVAGLLLHLGVGAYVSPGTLAFGCAVLLGSVAMASLTYWTIERPLDRVRSRVRGEALPQTAPSIRRGRWAGVTVVGVAVGLAVLATPVGLAVDYVSRATTGTVPPLSPAFNIRWGPEVTDEDRARAEADLGLVEPEQVLRDPRLRTWSYRLRLPTPDRVRAIIRHPAVEDTSGIDTNRLEITQ